MRTASLWLSCLDLEATLPARTHTLQLALLMCALRYRRTACEQLKGSTLLNSEIVVEISLPKNRKSKAQDTGRVYNGEWGVLITGLHQSTIWEEIQKLVRRGGYVICSHHHHYLTQGYSLLR
jgi:hypothetical protein